MKVAIYTLGCKVNQYETQAMEQELLARGHTLTEFSDEADAYIVNTCSVTAVSDQKSRQVIDLHGHRLDANGLAHQDLACGLLLALTAGGGRRDRSSRAAPCGCGLGRRSLAGDFRRHLSEAVYAHQQMLQLLQLRISQLRPGGEAQRQRHAGLVDASAVHHCAGQTKPQLSGELQLSKHFKKGYIS